MKVRELRELLHHVDNDLDIVIQGCDCDGQVSEVTVEEKYNTLTRNYNLKGKKVLYFHRDVDQYES